MVRSICRLRWGHETNQDNVHYIILWAHIVVFNTDDYDIDLKNYAHTLMV